MDSFQKAETTPLKTPSNDRAGLITTIIVIVIGASCLWQIPRWVRERDMKAVKTAEALSPSCSCISVHASLAAALADSNGIGPRVLEMRFQDDGTAATDAAFDTIRNLLPPGLRTAVPRGVLYQTGDASNAQSVSFFIASLGCVQVGESKQGSVSQDSGWTATQQGCLQRTVSLVMDGANVRLVQQRHGAIPWQESSYSWSEYKYKGNGTDLALPIVDAHGNVRAYLMLSTYGHNYYVDSRTQQQSAVLKWKSGAEKLQRLTRRDETRPNR